ncbi:MAG: 1-acyl-sn-glycerol-3-phosphate acyltransferase [Deltaproteobacteria bacterium]|nr:MAG: 1-acyl-sn-glycerol-3-phosphate acyltransferase [Deltaproteobacteria bacterium]
MTDDALLALEPAAIRRLLPSWLAATVTEVGDEVERVVAEVVAASDDTDLARAFAALQCLGEEFRLYEADPFARRVSRAYMGPLLRPGSDIDGVDHVVGAAQSGPVLLVGNHRSYVDTQLTDALLARVRPDLADRLVTVAGPKVYATTFRRFASLGLTTLKTAQSTRLATNDAGLSAREVARIALNTVRQAHRCMQAGRPVLLYPEGTRSRTGRLGPFLRAAERYARLDGLQVVPVALTGSEQVFPIDAEQLGPAVVHLRFGRPLRVDAIERGGVLAAARTELAELLGEG